MAPEIIDVSKVLCYTAIDYRRRLTDACNRDWRVDDPPNGWFDNLPAS
ncbi:hypothetical protein H8E77_21420 [bacterium]|nr:hypothetical protein [bacterium]